MIRRTRRILSLFAATLVMLACVPTFSAAPTPPPTFDPNSLLTTIVETAAAAATQTAILMPPTSTPTSTPRPTETPTGTATPTFIFLLPTNTVPPTIAPTSDVEFDCQILSQTPLNNTVISRFATFETRWLVANVGMAGWDSATADHRYYKGEKLHLQPIYDFPKSVSPGETIEFIVSMQAPSTTGIYSTTWRIGIGKSRFCNMEVTIVVN